MNLFIRRELLPYHVILSHILLQSPQGHQPTTPMESIITPTLLRVLMCLHWNLPRLDGKPQKAVDTSLASLPLLLI